MTDQLLTLNAGSSSIKVALFDAAGADGALPAAHWSGQADGLGAGLDARLRIRDAQGRTLHDAKLEGDARSHRGALAALLDWHAQQGGAGRIAGVGHRIVHGGMDFVAPVRIDDAVLEDLAALEPLAPLHQPHNLAGVRAAMQAFAGVPQVACFDTAFHAVQPELNRRFALPRELHDAGVRRYGFHGLSYESIAHQLARQAPEVANGRVIVAHLGNGASMCAIAQGRSVATTMSFSPLDGLTMGTRCGRLDAAVVLYLMRSRGMSADAVEKLLFRESGLLGLGRVERHARARSIGRTRGRRGHRPFRRAGGAAHGQPRGGPARCRCDRVHGRHRRERCRVARAGARGLRLDGGGARCWRQCRGQARISTGSSRVGAWVLRTDEEAVIARHTARVLA